MELTEDLIAGDRLRVTGDGPIYERAYCITGVTGTGYAKLKSALTDSGLPLLHDQHPADTLCRVREIILEPMEGDNETVRARVIYARASWLSQRKETDTIEVGGTLSQEHTNLDKDGNTMWTEYTYSSDPNVVPDANFRGKTLRQGGLVSLLLPQHTIHKSRIEYSDPGPMAKYYVGTVNSGQWNLDPPAPARTWMCTGIVGRSNDGGRSYITTYDFQYRFDTWDKEIMFNDPQTGRPPPDVNDATMASYPNGQKKYRRYLERNFNGIGL